MTPIFNNKYLKSLKIPEIETILPTHASKNNHKENKRRILIIKQYVF